VAGLTFALILLVLSCRPVAAQVETLGVGGSALDNASLVRLAEEKRQNLRISSEARRELVVIVQAVIGRRIAANFLGYEKTREYLDGLDSVYANLSSALDESAKGLHDSSFPSAEFRATVGMALNASDDDFKRFYSQIALRDPVLQGKSSSEIKVVMVLFSSLIYSKDPIYWQSMNRISYFWPACRKMDIKGN
jgi:hypothetical protein